MKIGKPLSAKRAKFVKPTRGGGRKGSKYDEAINTICALEIDQYLPIEVPENTNAPKFRAAWAQMLSSRVRPALMEQEGVRSRVKLSKDFEAVFLEGVDDRIAILCKENEYTAEDEARDKARTEKAVATRSSGGSKPKAGKVKVAAKAEPVEEVEEEDEDTDIEF